MRPTTATWLEDGGRHGQRGSRMGIAHWHTNTDMQAQAAAVAGLSARRCSYDREDLRCVDLFGEQERGERREDIDGVLQQCSCFAVSWRRAGPYAAGTRR